MRNQVTHAQHSKPTLLSLIIAWPQAIRIKNVLIMVFLQFLLYTYILEPWAYKLAYNLKLNLFWLVIQMISTAFIATAGYLINDYYDQKIDQINVPDRRVIGKIIQPKLALKTYIALNIIGIVFAIPLFDIHWSLPIIHIFSVILLWLYAKYLKAIPLLGNIIITFLCAMVAAEIFIADQLLLAMPKTLNPDNTTEYYQAFAWEYILFIMSATLLREWSKDIEDMTGDEKGNRKTLPLLLGWTTMRCIILIGLIILMLLLGLKSWNLWQQAYHYSSAYVGMVLCLSLLIPISMLIFFINKPKKFKLISSFLKLYFLLGLGWLLFFCN